MGGFQAVVSAKRGSLAQAKDEALKEEEDAELETKMDSLALEHTKVPANDPTSCTFDHVNEWTKCRPKGVSSYQNP